MESLVLPAILLGLLLLVIIFCRIDIENTTKANSKKLVDCYKFHIQIHSYPNETTCPYNKEVLIYLFEEILPSEFPMKHPKYALVRDRIGFDFKNQFDRVVEYLSIHKEMYS